MKAEWLQCETRLRTARALSHGCVLETVQSRLSFFENQLTGAYFISPKERCFGLLFKGAATKYRVACVIVALKQGPRGSKSPDYQIINLMRQSIWPLHMCLGTHVRTF